MKKPKQPRNKGDAKSRRGAQTGRNISGLRPFQPGQSGNPGGRPKKMHLTDALREELEDKGSDGVANDVAIARKLVKMARAGNMDAIKEIGDRTEGKPRQRIEASGPEGGPLPFDIPDNRTDLERRIAELLRETEK